MNVKKLLNWQMTDRQTETDSGQEFHKLLLDANERTFPAGDEVMA